MSIAVVASADASTTSTSLTINVPSGTANGDVMVMSVVAHNTNDGYPSVATPSGWTLLTSVSQEYTSSVAYQVQYVFTRVASSEPASYSVPITYAASSSNQGAAGGITSYSGVNTSTPVDTDGSGSSTAVSTLTVAALTAANADEMWIAVGAVTEGGAYTWTTPSGFTDEFTVTPLSTGTNYISMAYYDQLLSASGSTGTATLTLSSNAGVFSYIALLLIPASGSAALASGDTISITDSATLESGTDLGSADAVAIDDSATLESGAALGSADTVAIDDTASLESGAGLSSQDSVGIDDSATLTVIAASYFNWYMYSTTPQNSLVTQSLNESEAEALRIALGFASKIPIGPLTPIYPGQVPQPVS